jgi:hypothetical protein
VRHLLTAPYSPTTTSKVERFHKTLRAEFLAGRLVASIEQAQAELDAWVESYNIERPHQGIGMVAPIKRFELAARAQQPVAQQPDADVIDAETDSDYVAGEGELVRRRVREGGRISLDGFDYYVGAYLEGKTVEILSRANGLVEVRHRGVFLACHPRRRPHEAKRLQRSPGEVRRSAGRFASAHRRPERRHQLRRRYVRVRQAAQRRAGRGAHRQRRRAPLHARDPPRSQQGARCLRDPQGTTTSTDQNRELR